MMSTSMTMRWERPSRVNRALDGTRGDGASYFPGLSGDGRLVSFGSDATNLVVGDSNSAPDLFVFDRVAGTTTRVSVDVNGAEALGASYGASLSADGRAVVFVTQDSLVPADVGTVADVYVHDRFGATVLVSRVPAGAGETI